MPQLFPPYATSLARVALASVVAVPAGIIGLLILLQVTPHATRQNLVVEQPIQFSHEHHVSGLGLDCRYCHTSVEHSHFASVPPTHTCMTCHSQLWTNAEILAPVRKSLAEGKPIRWRRVNSLADYVYFDHSVHVTNGIGCSTCHGRVDRMPQVRQAMPLTMGWCLDCHRNPVPHLRPESEIYNMDWTPPADQEQRGRELIRHYLIQTEHLTDCTRCHR